MTDFSRDDSVYIFITGIPSIQQAFAEILKLINEKLPSNPIDKTIQPNLRIRAAWVNDDLTMYEGGFSSKERNYALVYFILNGGFEKTFTDPGVAYSMISNHAVHTMGLENLLGKKLYDIKDFREILPEAQQNELKQYTNSLSPSDAAFVSIITVYSGKLFRLDRDVKAFIIPKLTIPLTARVVDELVSLPRVMIEFASQYHIISDFFKDEVSQIKAEVTTPYVDDIIAMIQEQIVNWRPTKFIRNMLMYRFFDTKPKRLDYPNRVTWNYQVFKSFADYLTLYFNYRLTVDQNEVQKFVRIEPTDNPHELDSYFRLKMSTYSSKQPMTDHMLQMCHELLTIIIANNPKAHMNHEQALISFLLWSSINNTNRLRLTKRCPEIEIRINGTDHKINFSAAELYLDRRSNIDNRNYLRKVAGIFASYTLKLRFYFRLYHNPWKSLAHVDGRLAFDTIGYVHFSNIPRQYLTDYKDIMNFLHSNKQPVRGTTYSQD